LQNEWFSSCEKHIKHRIKKAKTFDKSMILALSGGERGIRTPGGMTHNSFQDCRNRPLCHFSGAKLLFFLNYQLLLKKKINFNKC
jgi:hypothetical protein